MEIDLSNPRASGGGEGESLVGRNKAERGAVRRARRGGSAGTHEQVQSAFEPGPSPDVEGVDEPAVPATSARTDGVGAVALAKPPVRKLAKDLGVDLTAVAATGPGGTVTRADVESAASLASSGGSAAAPAPAAVARTDREWREPVKGVRKMMAGAMVQSAFSAPHVTEWVTIDATRTMEFVDRLKKRREFRDVKVSPLLVLARAVMLAIRRTPEINSWWDEASQEVVYKSYVNLGIAAATPRGLVVPNVKDAESMSLLELADALNALTATARDGQDPAGRDERRDLHDHQRRRLRRRRGHPDHQPGRVGDPLLRRDQEAALGGRGRDRGAPGDDARPELRPPAHRRREGLALPRRRRRHPRGPGLRTAVLTRPAASWSTIMR